MTADSTLPLRPNTATAGICWDHRLVRGAFGALEMRQRYGLQIRDRLTSARNPVVSRAARNAWECGNKIGGSEAGKLFSECHHRHSKSQIKIRNAENRACKCPQCGHNNSTMNTYTLLRHVSLYPSIRRYRSKKDIGPLGWGETAVRLDFRLWGIWWAVKSSSGIKLVDGTQMPVHVMHSLDGKVIMGQRDIEAAKGTAYAEAWRESMISAINARVGIEA